MSKLTAPSAESILEDISDTSWGYFGWFQDVTVDEDAQTVTVTVDDPNHSEASRTPLTKTLPVEKIRQAWRVQNGHDRLCCGSDMLTEGFGFGCAADVDVVLQEAMFGELVYG